MNSKDITLEELGYKLFLQNTDTIIYKCKTDYIDYSIFFNLGEKPTYHIDFADWIDNTSDNWLPMEQREENLKHCAKYGRWLKVEYPIPMSLHQAIHNKCKELGWLDE